jgi:16S rRNA (guanine527-N7)-methyltransferase
MKKSIQTEFAAALERNAPLFAVTLNAEAITRLTFYYDLLLRWNPRLHLVAPCAPEEFATRHVLESLMLLPYLKRNARVVDVGSGGGLPIIPCLALRTDIRATLIESSPKKSVFLREALKTLQCEDRATVVAERFEKLPAPEADAITCRALERFEALLPRLIDWTPPQCRLLLFAGASVLSGIEATGLKFKTVPVPGSERRKLIVAERPGAFREAAEG